LILQLLYAGVCVFFSLVASVLRLLFFLFFFGVVVVAVKLVQTRHESAKTTKRTDLLQGAFDAGPSLSSFFLCSPHFYDSLL
jgi:hypothetical protein